MVRFFNFGSMNKVKKEKSSYFIIILVITLMIIGYSLAYKENKLLQSNYEFTIGIIIRKFEVPKRGYQIRYKYRVNNNTYEENQRLTIKQEMVNIGDEFKVKYSLEQPDVSHLIFDR